jgi:hypothetical protein
LVFASCVISSSTSDLSLRELYRHLELPGASPLKDAHKALDQAVREAYGMKKAEDVLQHLLSLNELLASREALNKTVVGPGLPVGVKDRKKLISADCIAMPD